MVEFDFRPYRVRLYRGPDPRLRGQWYLVELDLTSGYAADISYRRLAVTYWRLIRLDGTQGSDLDVTQLQVTEHPADDNPFWWVPNRPDDEEGWS